MTTNRLKSLLTKCLVYAASLFTVAVLLVIVADILRHGVPHLTPDLFAWKYDSVNVSLTPALINTLSMTLLALLAAVPAGLGAAIYLAEYAARGRFFVKAVRITAETLSGIPSIIYGLFGLLFFVTACRMGISLLAGAMTLAMMILPLVMRTAEEALRAVPDSYREASFGLGAGRLRTVFCVVLPSAVPGILAGVILSIGRIVGETAALIYTAGTVAEVACSVFDSSRTLAVHMYTLSSEGLYMNQTYATAVMLLIITAGINALSSFAARRFVHGSV
ncbi:phosphate ABC transporter permease PstA [Pyramidobacter sp. CG50-2]|uniref:phosphate ABC transporter permease PstA n=1 Tax=Pyramidobacter sp. CG50-2 TaxID=2382160 RepID=UPI0018F5E34A|nr:phosphate ABC transporter permease PstA [Pyramidobacter sp. CG50-2]